MYRACCGTIMLLVGLACAKTNSQPSDSSTTVPTTGASGGAVAGGDSVVVMGGDAVGGDSVVVTGGDTVVVTGGDTIKVNGRGIGTAKKNIMKCRYTVTWNQPANETRKRVVFLTCRPRP